MTVELKRPALLLEGGPRHGWGYYLDDWERMVRSAARVGAGPELSYYRPDMVPTRGGGSAVRREVHPGTGGSRGGQESERWVWRPPAALPVHDPLAPQYSTLDDILAALAMCGPEGGTAVQVAANMSVPAQGHQVVPGLHWLRRRGVVECSGDFTRWRKARRSAPQTALGNGTNGP